MRILKETGFPNTYCLTKHLAEHALIKKMRPGLHLSMSRPAMVTCTHKYPFPGWVDSLAAFGSTMYMLGKGISRYDMIYPGLIAPVTPCDYVVNSILVQTVVSVAE